MADETMTGKDSGNKETETEKGIHLVFDRAGFKI
jgi:hypothetical protein